MRVASRTGLFASAIFVFLAFSAKDAAPQGAGPPDLSSGGAAWDGIGQGDFIAVPGWPEPVGQDPNHERVPNNVGGQPNYRISDVSNPNLQQWAKDVMQKDNEEVLAGKIAFSPRATCHPGGVPGFNLMGGGLVFFLQSPTDVVMIHDGDSQLRRIHLNAAHAPDPAPSWYGDSVGHYEGDTLVVDTIALNDESFIDAYRTPHTGKMHVIERWRLAEGGAELEVFVTVDDPGTFNAPWQGLRRFERVPARLEERICAENNEHVFDYDIPEDDTPDF